MTPEIFASTIADASMVAVLHHAGSRPAPCPFGFPVAGTDDPDVWRVLLRYRGGTFAAELKNDCRLGTAPSLVEVVLHFRRYGLAAPGTPWRRADGHPSHPSHHSHPAE